MIEYFKSHISSNSRDGASYDENSSVNSHLAGYVIGGLIIALGLFIGLIRTILHEYDEHSSIISNYFWVIFILIGLLIIIPVISDDKGNTQKITGGIILLYLGTIFLLSIIYNIINKKIKSNLFAFLVFFFIFCYILGFLLYYEII